MTASGSEKLGLSFFLNSFISKIPGPFLDFLLCIIQHLDENVRSDPFWKTSINKHLNIFLMSNSVMTVFSHGYSENVMNH